jgi:hypothetical protein
VRYERQGRSCSKIDEKVEMSRDENGKDLRKGTSVERENAQKVKMLQKKIRSLPGQ